MKLMNSIKWNLQAKMVSPENSTKYLEKKNNQLSKSQPGWEGKRKKHSKFIFSDSSAKKKKRPICSILCIKFLDKILAKGVCVCVFHKLQGLLQKCKAGSTFKSSQTIHHINRLQKKSRMITSAEREKVFDKIQHQFIMKALCKLGGKPTKLGFKTSV